MKQSEATRLDATQVREQMSVAVIGHVDHGKSTVIGRLMADTGCLPEGRLEAVRARCDYNSRPFEYAFLLDALKDEQSQGITIDSARCFFKSERRDYIIIDAPGHIEFLKNMVSGAARAQAALLVIDAEEGVRENSRRHGYLLNMIGVRQVAVIVNKMDLVGYRRERFEEIREEFTDFLHSIGTEPMAFVPVSAREGVNIVEVSEKTPWWRKGSVLETLDGFTREPDRVLKPFRMPVQDIYKFTEQGDSRRIIAGTIETGEVGVGDEVVFLPSGKTSKIAGIEVFHAPASARVAAGRATGVTLDEQIYITPGEIMCRSGRQMAMVGTHLRVNIFWMGRRPMIKGKRYKLKIGTARVAVWLNDVVTVLDASELTTDATRQQIERHDVAECVLETLKPVAFDLSHDIPQTGRFVIIDNYEIAGGGVVQEAIESETNMLTERVEARERNWERSRINPGMRAQRYRQGATLVLISGNADIDKENLAKLLEEDLFSSDKHVYYLGLSNSLMEIGADIDTASDRDEYLRRLGEISHLFTDAGLILITTVSDPDDYELGIIKQLNQPNDCLVVNIGPGRLSEDRVDLQIDDLENVREAIGRIKTMLSEKKYLLEYYL